MVAHRLIQEFPDPGADELCDLSGIICRRLDAIGGDDE